YCQRFALGFEIPVSHGHRGFFMTISNELGIPIAPIVDDRFLQTTKTGAGIGADVFETERLDNVDHIVRATSVRSENLNLGRRARSLLRSRSGRPNDRSRARQHPVL